MDLRQSEMVVIGMSSAEGRLTKNDSKPIKKSENEEVDNLILNETGEQNFRIKKHSCVKKKHVVTD